jgi:hypothetical protein
MALALGLARAAEARRCEGDSMRTTVTAVLFSMAAGAAWAQGPAMPERRLYRLLPPPQPASLKCTVLRDGTLLTLANENQNADSVARFFDPLGEPRLVPVTVAAANARAAHVAARGEGFVAVWFDEATSKITGRTFAADGAPLGGTFDVGLGAPPDLAQSAVKGMPDGGFLVAWTAHSPNTSEGTNVYARRYSPAGVGGAAFRLNEVAEGHQHLGGYDGEGLDVAADGSFTVTWLAYSFQGQALGVFVRRFDAAGNALGADALVSATAADNRAAVAAAADGTSLVVWQRGLGEPPTNVYARRYDAAGVPLGAEFRINAEDGANIEPQVVAGAAGSFTVAWRRSSGQSPFAFKLLTRTVAADGTPAGPSTPAGTTQAVSAAALAPDAAGGFAVCWRGLEISFPAFFDGAVARRYAALAPAPSTADAAPAAPPSNGNGILDPGERVVFRPAWRNHGGAPVGAFTGHVSSLEGPGGPLYTLYDDTASYDAAPAGASTGCAAGGDCYELGVVFTWPRPALDWDATLDERLSTGQLQRWRLHVGGSFWDVPPTSPYYRFAETLLHHGITSGCAVYGTGAAFCPTSAVTREQLAPFVLVAREGAGYRPDLTAGEPAFTDVPISSPYYPFIEELARRGVVNGCAPARFCPERDVTRAEAAVFVLRTLDPELMPPLCATPLFEDVPASSPFCPWIEELARRGVVNGCAAGRFCPGAPVLREQMAVVLTQAFGLSAYSF